MSRAYRSSIFECFMTILDADLLLKITEMKSNNVCGTLRIFYNARREIVIKIEVIQMNLFCSRLIWTANKCYANNNSWFSAYKTIIGYSFSLFIFVCVKQMAWCHRQREYGEKVELKVMIVARVGISNCAFEFNFILDEFVRFGKSVYLLAMNYSNHV